jgi:hypothetical protein
LGEFAVLYAIIATTLSAQAFTAVEKFAPASAL